MPSIDITQYPDTVEAFGGNQQRPVVFLDRYALKNSEGRPVESLPTHMWQRVSIALGKDLDQQTRFYSLLRDWKFVPGGRILAGAGTGSEVTFYNCYVIPVETRARRKNRDIIPGREEYGDPDPGNDSREAIFDTIGLMVDIMSRGGGVGINWSVLRPKGAYLKRVNGSSSGPVGWMDVASKAVGEVEQGGSRRGAAMFMLDDWHPDLLEFIDAKRDMSRILNANVSVAVSDDFMEAVEAGADWTFWFPDTSHPAYDAEWDGDLRAWEAKGYPVVPYDNVSARWLWRKLAEAAHASGEPGVVFLDRYNKMSTAKGVERLISVNPCGEQGLGPYSVCNLGAMNLDAYVDDGVPGDVPVFDWGAFEHDVRTAVEFLDRAIDVNFYFLPENEKVQKDLRRIGLSVMGLADALIRLGIRYGSPEAVAFTEDVFRTMKDAAIESSATLAREYGPAPAWDDSMWERPYLKEYTSRKGWVGISNGSLHYPPLRNLFLLTQAPTGTTSILAGVNSGIEPLFDLGYWREDRTGKHWVQPGVLDKIGYDGGWTADFLVTANDVSVEEHIAMQAAVQKYVDSSVSKTINAPADQTVEEVEKAYTLAYEMGLKGLAYYRDGSRNVQVLSHEDSEKEKAALDLARMASDLVIENAILKVRIKELEEQDDFQRPQVLFGTTRQVQSKSGSVYVTVNRDGDGRPVEVFFMAGKSGEESMVMAEAMGRLASLALRKGATLGGVANQLEGIGGMTNIAFAKTVPHAIGQALTEENRRQWDIDPGIQAQMPQPVAKSPDLALSVDQVSHKGTGLICPSCGDDHVVREEGCSKCHSCGWSAC